MDLEKLTALCLCVGVMSSGFGLMSMGKRLDRLEAMAEKQTQINQLYADHTTAVSEMLEAHWRRESKKGKKLFPKPSKWPR